MQTNIDSNTAALGHETVQACRQLEGQLARIENRLTQREIEESRYSIRISEPIVSSLRPLAESTATRLSRVLARLGRLAGILHNRLISLPSDRESGWFEGASGLRNTASRINAMRNRQSDLCQAARITIVRDDRNIKSSSSINHEWLEKFVFRYRGPEVICVLSMSIITGGMPFVVGFLFSISLKSSLE